MPSKASEWAANENANLSMPEIEAGLVFVAAGASASVTVWPRGVARLTIWKADAYSHPTFDAREALALAHWLIDTFSDEAKP